MAQHSSDEEEEDKQRSTSRSDAPPKKSPFTGAAFAEVVRATIKANEIAAAAAKSQ